MAPTVTQPGWDEVGTLPGARVTRRMIVKGRADFVDEQGVTVWGESGMAALCTSR